MALIYLDTSNHDVLERTLRTDPDRFAAFLATWRTLRCELVFSRTHLVELLRHGDPEVRSRRFDLLERLLPLKSDVVTRQPVPPRPVLLLEREVITALRDKGLVQFDSPNDDDWFREQNAIFPHRWTTASDVDIARSFDEPAFRTIISAVHSAVELSTQAQTRAPNTPYVLTKLRDLPTKPMSTTELAEARRNFDEAFAMSDEEVRRTFPLWPVEQMRELMTAMQAPMRRMIERAAEVGMMRAYAETMCAALDGEDGRRTLDQVTLETVFAESVRAVGADALGLNASEAHHLAHIIRIEDCPGQWLLRAVEVELRRREPEPHPSNAYDLEHVGHLPYVDLLFTDKRVGSATVAVLARSVALPQRRGLKPPVWVAATIDAVEDALIGQLKAETAT